MGYEKEQRLLREEAAAERAPRCARCDQPIVAGYSRTLCADCQARDDKDD